MNRTNSILSRIKSKTNRLLFSLLRWIFQHPIWSMLILLFYILYYTYPYIFSWYQFHPISSWPDWIGLSSSTKFIISQYDPISGRTYIKEISQGKTLWDLLELIIIPLALVIVAWLFNRAERIKEQNIAKEQQKENILKTYLSEMDVLLLEKKLKKEKYIIDSSITKVAQMKTISTLRSLDKIRRDIILQYLIVTEISDFILKNALLGDIDLSGNQIMHFNFNATNLNSSDLSNAYLNDVNFTDADLFKANLEKVIMSSVKMTKARMISTNLDHAFLSNVDFCEAHLFAINFRSAHFFSADLSRSDLRKADFTGANIEAAKMIEANLNGAIMKNAILNNTDMTRSNLSDANLSNVILDFSNLSGAIVTQKQLSKAKSLKEVIMPDGSIHP